MTPLPSLHSAQSVHEHHAHSSIASSSSTIIIPRCARLGYDNTEIVDHGFWAIASTMLNEQGWHPDLIELQLAHAERNKVRAAYNRAERPAERRQMMQAWADYLYTLRSTL